MTQTHDHSGPESPVLDFLQANGARRAGGYGDAPDFFGPARAEDGDGSGPDTYTRCEVGYEFRSGTWERVVVRNAAPFRPDDPLTPRRFVDGKDVGRVVAYVASPAGFPVPVRLSQVGAVALRAVPGTGEALALRVESRRVEKVVSLMGDLFPWDEIERFAAGLHACGFRLLIARRAGPEDDFRNVAWLQENVRYRTREEMFRMERRAVSARCEGKVPPVTVADGRLDDKEEAVRGDAPLVGLVKTQASTSYLHEEGWAILYALRPGERTPALALTTEKSELVTWYVRLTSGGGGPLDGLVRVELPRAFFEGKVGKDFGYLDRLSRALCAWRTRDAGYGRSGVTLHPIQQAEERLGAHLLPTDTLVSRFYKISGL